MTNDPKEENTSPLGALIRRLREEAGMTLYELEKLSKVGRGTLTKIENGMLLRRPTAILNEIARGLGVEPEVLYDAAWQATEAPLPSPSTYFRSKFNLSPEQIAELERSVEEMSKEQDQAKERRSP